MIDIDIPGFGRLQLQQLVLDYNGTLACDGTLLEGVAQRLHALASELEIHVVTADTFGTVRKALEGLPAEVVVLPPDGQDVAKGRYVRELGAGNTVAIGNGRNDSQMLREAVLGIVVVQEEAAALQAVSGADIACAHITVALDLLAKPRRLLATLRS